MSMMLITLMFSLRPSTPGWRQQAPLTMRLILTPARLALYSRFIISGSVRLLNFALM